MLLCALRGKQGITYYVENVITRSVRMGESWLLPKLAQQDGPFPFLDILEKGSPIASKEGGLAYIASNNPEVDIEKLTHFALGIFWKASVHSWSGTKKG